MTTQRLDGLDGPVGPVDSTAHPAAGRSLLDVTLQMGQMMLDLPDNTYGPWALSDPPEPPGFTPQPGWLDLGFHLEDLLLWQAAFLTRPIQGSGNPAIAWGVLSNYLMNLGDLNADVGQHDALAWLIVDPSVVNLADGGLAITRWEEHTPHGWLPHAAGLSPHEYAHTGPREEDLRLLAALRLPFALPPVRS